MKVPHKVKAVAIETVPMTTEEYNRAVTALADLIQASEDAQLPGHNADETSDD